MEIVQETSRVTVGVDVSNAWLDVHVTDSKRHFRVTNDVGALPSWCGGSVAAAPFGW